MKSTVVKILAKTAVTFLGVLLIIAGLQFMVRVRSADLVDLMMAEMAAESGSGTEQHLLGVDRPWRPDLWPFDDQSLWTSDGTSGSTYQPTTPSSSYSQEQTIGLSTGGSKDINNFRDNIYNNYLPLPTAISYEGLFYDYYFDTGISETCNKLFCPSYSYAVTRDPISHQPEYYMSVGLNSGLRQEDFQRKKLNLVIVMDVSASMTGQFNRYYYDSYGTQTDAYEEEGINRLTKIDSAKQAVTSILDQLRYNDRFAIVLFNDNATLAKSMGPVAMTDMRNVKEHIFDLYADGGTNLSSGIRMATTQFRGLSDVNNYEYENRIIVLTDAQPNTGDLSTSRLSGIVSNNAKERIYTTFIGIGVDFNNQLIELMTRTRGANYYSVHSPGEFRERVEEEFDFMVTPLVFNVQLKFESDDWRIQQVIGSPEADAATGHLMRINTLFPSNSSGGQNKGGLVLLRLQKISHKSTSDSVYLTVSYEDRNGFSDSSRVVLSLAETSPEYFSNSGIRKGVLLARYATLLKNWSIDEREHWNYSKHWNPRVREDTGIIISTGNLSQWEQTSLPLNVSRSYQELFNDFSDYFDNEMGAIGDYSLDQELAILRTLAEK